jgi:hypothetical protein
LDVILLAQACRQVETPHLSPCSCP